jgi:hypothetical protein
VAHASQFDQSGGKEKIQTAYAHVSQVGLHERVKELEVSDVLLELALQQK